MKDLATDYSVGQNSPAMTKGHFEDLNLGLHSGGKDVVGHKGLPVVLSRTP